MERTRKRLNFNFTAPPSDTDFVYVGPKNASSAFQHRLSHPLLLELLLLKEFGPEYLEWEPETLWTELAHTYGQAPSASVKSKVQSVRACQVSDAPYLEWEAFEKVCRGYGGSRVRFDFHQPPKPENAAAFVHGLGLIRENVKVSDEVFRYLAAVLNDAGMVYAPSVLEPANKYLLHWVDKKDQDEVRARVKNNDVPDAIGDAIDLQVAKSVQVVDYVAYVSKLLKEQTDVVLGGAEVKA